MAKVKIDTDVVSNTLLPLAKNEINKLSNVISVASTVSYPNGEYNWSSIVNELEDCREQANKYYNWIANVNNKFINMTTDCVDDISSTAVTEIKRRTTIVK